MADDMRRRREIVAAAFAARRGELDLTQEDVARIADVAVRTIVNFESQGVWPNARTRARLERAVEWPLGHIARLADTPPEVDPQLLERVQGLSQSQREWLIGWLVQAGIRRDEEARRAAEG